MESDFGILNKKTPILNRWVPLCLTALKDKKLEYLFTELNTMVIIKEAWKSALNL